MDIYEEYLKRLKESGYVVENAVLLEKAMNVARNAGLPLENFGRREVKDRFEIKLSLVPVFALYEAFKSKGDEGYIVYSDSNGDIVRHYVTGQIIAKTK